MARKRYETTQQYMRRMKKERDVTALRGIADDIDELWPINATLARNWAREIEGAPDGA